MNSDIVALIVSVLIIRFIILLVNYDGYVMWSQLFLDLTIGFFSYILLYYLLSEKNYIWRIPTIILIIIGGSQLWFTLKSIENIVAGRGLISINDFSYFYGQILLFAMASLIIMRIKSRNLADRHKFDKMKLLWKSNLSNSFV